VSSTRWTAEQVPDQKGRTAVVTGANSGIGFETASVLARRGAHVVLAVRDVAKGADAVRRIKQTAPDADLAVQRLDLSSIESVRTAANELASDYDSIDLLINNAGVMWTPKGTTTDGFETQFGTNHLGHFAFTGLVLDHVLASPGSRVVTISSIGHRTGRIDFDDLQSERRYGRHSAYARSKLANLMFTYELQRRLDAAGAKTIAVAAHPGGSNTDLVRNSPAVLRFLNDRIGRAFMQSARMGALPTLRAAADPQATGGQYFGPKGITETSGFPVVVRSSRRSHDVDAQRRLWTESERLTGVTYPI